MIKHSVVIRVTVLLVYCRTCSASFVRNAYQETHLPELNNDDMIVFYKYCCGWTIFFITGHYLIGMSLKMRLVEKYFDVIEEKKIRQLPSYIISLIHHVGIAPLCLSYIITDYYSYYNSGGVLFDENHYYSLYSPNGIFPFTIGYFVGDSITTSFPEAFQRGLSSKIFLVHHILALGMIFTTFSYSKGSLTQVFPCMMCSEFSTIFFNSAWVMRAIGLRKSRVVKLFEYIFAISFLLLRNIHFTVLIFILWSEMKAFGVLFQINVLMSMAMQYYWGCKIVMSSVTRNREKED